MLFSPTKLRLCRRAASWRFFGVSALSPNLSPDSQRHLKVGNFDFNLSNFNQFLRNDPSLALSFQVSLNVHEYATLVTLLSSHGNLDRKLDSVLVELIRNEKRGFCVMDLIAAIGEEEEAAEEEDKRSLLLVRVSSALVKAYVSLEMFDEAIDVLFQSNRLGCVPSIKSCNFLMNRLVEFGKNDMVVALFRQLKRLGLYANEYTYAIVVKALCRKGDLEEAAKLLEMAPSVFAYTAFIDGLCVSRKTDQAVVLIKELVDMKALAGDDLEAAYGMVVRGFCNEMKLEAAESVILEMDKIGIGVSVYACSVIIDRYCKNVDLPKAMDFLSTMLEKGLKLNCVIVSSILQCHCKMKEFSEALQKFEEFRDMNIFLDKVCYNVAFDALSKLGRVEEAIELLHEMMEKGMVPDVINYTTLVDGYCIQGKFVDALDLIDDMKGNGIFPDVITYNVLAGGLARNGHAKVALDIYDKMKAEGLKPNAVTHNVMIEGLCKARKIEEAEDFFRSLENKCPENYGSLVKGYCESGLPKKAFRLFIEQEFPMGKSVYFKLFKSLCEEGYLDKALVVMERMLAYGIEPGRSMYGIMIGALYRLNNAREAEVLFDTMVGRGLTPNLHTYTIMIHTYCRLNELQKADDLFEDMKQRGIKPDVVTYTVLLDNYLKLDPEHHETGSVQGEVRNGRTLEVWREFSDAGIKLDVVCYTVLIDHQCKIDNLEYAIKILVRMIDSGLKPDMVTCTALISRYCRKGYIDIRDFEACTVTFFTELSRKDTSPTEHFVAASLKSATSNAKRFQLLG